MRKARAHTLRTLIGAAILALGAQACVVVTEDDQAGSDTVDDGWQDRPGEVNVAWGLGGRSCDQAKVSTIDARLVGADGDVFAEATASCDDGAAVLGPLAPGVYRLVIRGTSDGGVITHQGGLEAVVVYEGQTTEPGRINLQARGSTVSVRWKFANGDLCTFNGTPDVELAVYDDQGREVHLMAYPCDPRAAVDLEAVPAGEINIIATAVDAEGNPRFRDHERIQSTFGGEEALILVLEDCEVRTGGCL